MTPDVAAYISVGVLMVILFSGIPIAAAMALVGMAGLIYVSGWETGLSIMKTVPYRTIASYDLSIVPLFVLMGAFAFHAGLSRDLYNTVYKWLGHVRGGLAMATVGGCAGFAAVSGSTMATAITMGAVALPEMKKYRYSPGLATGSVAAGGTIGILIPPSVPMVIYCLVAEQSVGKLFLAGFIPGILQAIFYMLTIYILARANPLVAPPGPKTGLVEKIVSLKDSWIVILLFVLVIGGIYAGVFSPTEAAGVGAFGAFLFGFIRRRLSWKNFVSSLLETGETTAMVFLIVVGAMVFGYFLSVSRLPYQLAAVVANLPVNRFVILAIIIIVYIFLGTIMTTTPMIVITVPIFFPIITALGFDPIWFGIIVVRMCEIGGITPPVGMTVFVTHGVAKDVPMYNIFHGVIPFLVADILHTVLLIAFPIISLVLPNMMK